MGDLASILRRFWGILRRFWGILGDFGGFWGILRRSWGILRRSCVDLASILRRSCVDFGGFCVDLASIFSLCDKCFGLWGVASLSETGRVNEMKDWEAARSTNYLFRRVSFDLLFGGFLTAFGPFW